MAVARAGFGRQYARRGVLIMVSAEARAELERLFSEQKPDRSLEQRRREWEAETRLHVLPKGARFSQIEAGGVPCEWMEMPRVARDRVFLLLHGGGYVTGSTKTHRRLAANLSRATHMRVLSPDYRLAPEHPFPAGVKDALRAYGWLLEQGLTADRIVVGGDSAGGGLALSMLLGPAGGWGGPAAGGSSACPLDRPHGVQSIVSAAPAVRPDHHPGGVA